MYQASLNLAQLNLYLRELAATDMIAHHPEARVYATTEKGRSFIRLFEQSQETGRAFEEQKRALEGMLTTRERKPVEVPVSMRARVSG